MTATVIKKRAEQMKKEGKSPEQIKKYLENPGIGRIAGGIGEIGLTYALANNDDDEVRRLAPLGRNVARAVGLYDTITSNRAKPKKKKKSNDEDDED